MVRYHDKKEIYFLLLIHEIKEERIPKKGRNTSIYLNSPLSMIIIGTWEDLTETTLSLVTMRS